MLEIILDFTREIRDGSQRIMISIGENLLFFFLWHQIHFGNHQQHHSFVQVCINSILFTRSTRGHSQAHTKGVGVCVCDSMSCLCESDCFFLCVSVFWSINITDRVTITPSKSELPRRERAPAMSSLKFLVAFWDNFHLKNTKNVLIFRSFFQFSKGWSLRPQKVSSRTKKVIDLPSRWHINAPNSKFWNSLILSFQIYWVTVCSATNC